MKNPSFICDLCKKCYSLKCNLRRHIQIFHTDANNKYFTCNDCGKTISRKDSFLRHLKTHNSDKPFTCHECSAVFITKQNLVFHRRRIHEVPKKDLECSQKFIGCKFCPKYFTVRSNLNRHIRRQHEKTGKEEFPCTFCDKVFSRKDNLNRHVETHTGISMNRKHLHCGQCKATFSKKHYFERHRRLHDPENEKLERDRNTFVCNECNKTVPRKDTLIVHLKSHMNKTNNDNQNFYECTRCLRNFTTERFLLQHIRKQHEHISGDGFECNECHTKFSCKGTLVRHISTVHAPGKERILQRRAPRLRCVKCEETFPNRTVLMEHYDTVHDIKQQFEYLLFESLDDFEEWRSPCYVHKTTWVTSVDTYVWRFSCHRSGIYQDSCAKNNRQRKRSMKTVGSKKLQGFCPGEITLRRRLSDGLCLVTLQKTHVGHSIDDINEVRHIRLTYTEKDWIARQLMVGVPKAEIEKKVTLNFDLEQTANRRLGALTLKDIGNVAAALKPKIPFNKANDPVHADVFVSERGNSILYYKKRKECDRRFRIFGDDDLVVIYQTNFQKSILQKHGHNVVAFDGMRGLNSYEFIVHTMLVVDAEDEGFAVAFLISNRSDQAVIDIFVRCVRENAGVIQATTLLSDTKNICVNAWRSVMGPTEFSFYHMWHVRKTWRENLHKLIKSDGFEYQTRKAAAKERHRLISDVKHQLFNLADESDKTTFEIKLQSFLTINDPVVEPFVNYFRENYVNEGNVDKWASCYRSKVAMKVNTHVESFHRTLKYAVAKKKKVGTLAAALQYLDLYIKRRTKQYFGKLKQPELSSDQEILRQRHSAAEKDIEKLSLVVEYDADLQKWYVGFFGASADEIVEIEMHSIQKNEKMECAADPDDCVLRCSSCKSCTHEYRCSCCDSAEQNNMCKHIHALCIFYENQEKATQAETAFSNDFTKDESVDSAPHAAEKPSFKIDTFAEPVRISSNSEDGSLVDLHKDIAEQFDRLKSNILKRVSVTPDSYDRWLMIERQILSRVLPAWDLLEKDRSSTKIEL